MGARFANSSCVFFHECQVDIFVSAFVLKFLAPLLFCRVSTVAHCFIVESWTSVVIVCVHNLFAISLTLSLDDCFLNVSRDHENNAYCTQSEKILILKNTGNRWKACFFETQTITVLYVTAHGHVFHTGVFATVSPFRINKHCQLSSQVINCELSYIMKEARCTAKLGQIFCWLLLHTFEIKTKKALLVCR